MENTKFYNPSAIEEFESILNFMKNSDRIACGEYYVIHEDHIHALEMAIYHYLQKEKIYEIKFNATEEQVDKLLNFMEELKIKIKN